MSKDLSELELLTERFAKLLLGEDMSGGKKGVSSALALSNAVTNLAASVFGELWRLGPLPADRRERWNREMGWFLSVVYHIVDFVPSYQSTADGSIIEVMVTVPRSDIQMNIPALKKLETMLLECLDKFRNAEFWYEERAAISDYDGQNKNKEDLYDASHGEKWWLPTPRVPDDGLTEETRKMLESQRDSVNQILKAAMAINSQVLSEMEIPDVYWESFPRNGRAVLGETLHRLMTSDNFSADVLLCSLNLSSEHSIVEIKNRIEAACVVWRKKMQTKEQHQQHQQHQHQHQQHHKRSTWSAAFGADDNNKRELYAQRADTILMLLKLRFPGLPQSLLDITKIQHNKDVGQSVLESYSRVLESLAFNVLSRINDVISADDAVRKYLRSSSLSASASASARLSFGSEAAESFSKFNSSLLASPVSQRIYPTPTASHMHVHMLSVMRTPSPSDFACHRSSAESTDTSSSPSASPSPRPTLTKATSSSSSSKPCSSTNNKTLSDFIGWHSHRHRHMPEYPTPPYPNAAAAVAASENEHTHDELVVDPPLKSSKGKRSGKKHGKHPHHWSFMENMGSMYSPPSRD